MGTSLSELLVLLPGLLALQGLAILLWIKLMAFGTGKTETRVAYATQARR